MAFKSFSRRNIHVILCFSFFLPSYSKVLENLVFDEEGYLIAYADGSCLNNGKPNASAGIGVWFNDSHPLNLSEKLVGRATNNNAEIYAATRAISQALSAGIRKMKIRTDSNFLLKCMTEWMWTWKKNGWKTNKGKEVKNIEHLDKLDNVISQMESVKWERVKAHDHIKGNEEADKLARQAASQ